MTRALVTGASGFIGRRVADLLKNEGHEVFTFDVADDSAVLGEYVAQAEIVFHFAGVNRPPSAEDFERVNAGFTARLCDDMRSAGNNAVIVLASSIQALLDNPYGQSKRHAEQLVSRFAEAGGRAAVFQLPNVFGPGCRPNYNSVVATFAHNTANGQPLQINDATTELSLVYVHDVARAFVDVIGDQPKPFEVRRYSVAPVVSISLGDLAQAFREFAEARRNARVPNVGDEFGKKLYATFLSYLPTGEFSYPLATRSDERGSLAEFLKSSNAGQLFISRTRPGKTRGNHFHHTKTEKFLVVEGDAVIRFRRADGSGKIIEYPVRGSEFRVVDIPPDYTHSIENVGPEELVVLFWASEIFDPKAPDTFALNVR